MTSAPRDADRADIEELLPWYATGRLSSADQRRVEAYLDLHPELHAGLVVAREEVAANVAANTELEGPDTTNLQRLLQRLPAQDVSRDAFGLSSMLDRVWDWLAELSPQQLGVAAAALITIVALEAVTIGTLIGTRPGVYETATSPTEPAAGATVELLIGFKPEVTMADATSFLKENGLMIIDGPRGGLFRVQARAGSASAVVLADTFRSSPLVITVLPGR